MTQNTGPTEVLRTSDARKDTRVYMTSVDGLTEHFRQGHGSFEGYAPAEIVERDLYLPFKQERTDELVEDLRQTRERDGWGNGQDSPMLAAYIIGEVKPAIEVYDGLHRQVANITFQEGHGIEVDRPTYVISAIGNTAVHFVTIKPMTRRDMLDKRLTNTRNHPELRFARGGLWTAQLWYLDDISSLAPELSAKQAFNIAERNAKDASRLGSRLGLSPEVVEQVADWAIKRAEAWSVDPSTIYKWIHRAEATTPAIIAQVRSVGKGSDGRGVITESMITSIANFMAGEQYHDIQSVVIKFATHHRLSDIQFNNLLAEIMSSIKIKDSTNIDQVIDFLDELDIAVLNADTKAVTNRRIRRHTDIFNRGGAAVASVGDAIDRVVESLDVRDERLHFVPDVDQRRSAIEAAEELETQAERALALAERARQHALGGIEQQANLHEHAKLDPADVFTDHVKARTTEAPIRTVPSFGQIMGSRRTHAAPELQGAKAASEILDDIRKNLPDIKKDALNGHWGYKELDDALEIVTVLAETLAQMSVDLQPKAENDTDDAS